MSGQRRQTDNKLKELVCPTMRDRLSHLQEMSNGHVEPMEYAESTVSDTFSNVDLEEELPHEAVVFDNSPALVEIFDQSQNIHREIQLIRLEVKRLHEQNSRMLHSVTTMSTIKRDSNVIGADIKARAEGVLSRLRDMEGTAHKLEEVHGSNSAITRVARTQYACLSNGFRDAMFDYNEAEMSHRENCKIQIQRQMEIVGREVTGEEVEEMIETGRWNIFTDNVVSEGKTARSALSQIEKRHQELVDLEARISGIHEIFLDIALLVEEQGPMLTTIQTNIQKTDENIQEALVKLGRAKRHDKNNPFKRMFCSCFPCFNQ
ncbi:syntaxin-11-like isoform X1 [Thunnus maccoyii]|uniref:syntaxin-11-like isoform X1 n=2 Tax=Thunnus maccoyii TaxID=8240 RepID=UPI001C4DD72C|nr:syntaxin-11-like isoform X1 [Thunnus maccoyii]